MITIEHNPEGWIVMRASGTLSADDYEAVAPEIDLAMKRAGPLRILIQLEDFRGWDAGGLWEEIRFDSKHDRSFERIAIVGETSLEHWGARQAQIFFSAQSRYFDRAQLDEAKAWLQAA